MCCDVGHAWETEYGDPDNETGFKYLMTYSPLHNVRVPAGTHQYPATLLTTGKAMALRRCQLFFPETGFTESEASKRFMQSQSCALHSGLVSVHEQCPESFSAVCQSDAPGP